VKSMDDFTDYDRTLQAQTEHESEEPIQAASNEEQTSGDASDSRTGQEASFTGGAQETESFTIIRTRATGSRRSRWLKRRPVRIAGLCALLILSLLILHDVLPASSANLAIEPQSQAMNVAYALTVSNQTDLAANHVRARMLTYKTSTLSQSTSVQSTGSVPPTSAHGTVVFSQISAEIKVDALDAIDLGNGLTLDIDGIATMEPGNTYTLPGHIQQTGSKGNLPADGLDGPYSFGGPFHMQGPSVPTAFLSNPQPFTGGADEYFGPVVSHTDTDPVAAGLYAQNEQEAQRYFASQLQLGEALLDNLTCNQNETDQPAIGSAATSVTVSLFSTCQIEAYDQQELNAALQVDAHRLALSTFDPHFVMQPPLQVTITSPGTPGDDDDISLLARSEWLMLLDKSGVQEIQRALAGLSQDDARALMQNRFSCQVDSLNLSWWWGGHMPADPNAIQLHYLEP
jgi:hypothetical protein